MCGIFGAWSLRGEGVETRFLEKAAKILHHRGPDDEGFLLINTNTHSWVELSGTDTMAGAQTQPISTFTGEGFNLAFGFRRLSIIDLTVTGHQPMPSVDRQKWIIFNGEIYNYLELRAELKSKGHSFRTNSDTEVILNAYAEWGEECVAHFNGMWAFAIWDANSSTLFCSRDRFGIKPFYYYWDQGAFIFASEIKALFAFEEVKKAPEENTLYEFLRDGIADNNESTFFVGIKQLPPSCCLKVEHSQVSIRKYWDLDPSLTLELKKSTDYSEAFLALFEDAVKIHMRSDVAIGTCLSGGLDSSSIVCMVNKVLRSEFNGNPQAIGNRQKTFSSCFDNLIYDERRYIEPVLETTGAEANFVFPKTEKLLKDIHDLVWFQEEPFGSTSIFAQWCIMETVAKKGVKVLLDGQGGDEVLSGYHNYFKYYWLSLIYAKRWPKLLQELWVFNERYGFPYLNSIFRLSEFPKRKIQKYLISPAAHFYRKVTGRNKSDIHKNFKPLGVSPDFAYTYGQERRTHQYSSNLLNKQLYNDLLFNSIPKLLHYEDRNSMAFSVEARVPFLDYRLVEFMFSVPIEHKMNNGFTKTILRNAMMGFLPEAVRLRSDKMGFVTPEKLWLSAELKDWASQIINSKSFRNRGFFDTSEIKKVMNEHTSGHRDLTFTAWRWINIELWMRSFFDR